MKAFGCLLGTFAYAAAVSVLLHVCPVEGAEGRAIVRAIRGSAEFSTTRDEWKPLRVGVALTPSSIVRTGVNSQVDLFLGENGPTVRLLAETTLGLDKLNLERTGIDVVIETFLDLQKGTIQGYVKPLAAASKCEVKTPFTVCAITGTDNGAEYLISADGKHHAIKGGLLVACGPPGSRYHVSEGHTFVPSADPKAPDALPAVRPTQPDEVPFEPEGYYDSWIIFFPPPPPPPTEPIQFISPGTGTRAGNHSLR